MIGEVRALGILNGYRRRPAADIDALAGAIVSLSHLAWHREVRELEINPLLVRGKEQGVIAVDALVRMRQAAPDASADEEVAS